MTVIAIMLVMAMVIVALPAIESLSLVAERASGPRPVFARRPPYNIGWRSGDSLWRYQCNMFDKTCLLFSVQRPCLRALSQAGKSEAPNMLTILGLARPSCIM